MKEFLCFTIINLVKLAGEALRCLSFSAWATFNYALIAVLDAVYKSLETKNQFRLNSGLVLRIRNLELLSRPYVRSKERTHYLSLVTDAFSRKIMGYGLNDDMSAENVAKFLQMAIKKKSDLPLIHHSDRGIQYCSGLYQTQLRFAQIQTSMTDGYDC